MKPRILLLSLSALLALPLPAQEGKLVVLEIQSKELKRAAHRLGIPVEQLRNARRLLQEATDLACKIDPPPPFDTYQQPAHLWQQIDRLHAEGTLKALINVARAAARDATNRASYRYATSTAFMLMSRIHPADYETARRFIRDWPPPPASAGESTHEYLAALERQL